ncbi:MAG: SGNH/GDSL hydrolase family protein [Candidatus Omnitrophica bacterium]|nr:SGNH/GDSL hydrolase family protein [Candidatus Omnitrophota bacterium]MDD5671708.1 SGNH/GDSL hydrolase family protein [Candidatus Omnitrophota bacterium]
MFSQHAADPRLLEKINQGPWDFIVLQEQSQMPALSQAQVRKAVYPQAKKLCDLIRQANPKARIVFYMTMAKKNGDLQNVRVMPVLSTYQGMQRRINQSYVAMAKQNRGLLAPVGQVWALVRRNKPSLELYSDDTHPNLTGTYLAACVFYAVLFNDSPLGLPHPQPVDNDTAFYLQKITAEVLSARRT